MILFLKKMIEQIKMFFSYESNQIGLREFHRLESKKFKKSRRYPYDDRFI